MSFFEIEELNKQIDTIKEMLIDRGIRYGKFKDLASIQVKILNMLRSMKGYGSLEPVVIVSLEMIIHKILRLLNSNEYHKDNLLDIVGYALRALEAMEQKEKTDKHSEALSDMFKCDLSNLKETKN